MKYVSSSYQNRGVIMNNQSSAHLSEITVKMSKTSQPAVNSYTEKVEGTYTAVLIVEGTKLYFFHEVKCWQVFCVKVSIVAGTKAAYQCLSKLTLSLEQDLHQ